LLPDPELTCVNCFFLFIVISEGATFTGDRGDMYPSHSEIPFLSLQFYKLECVIQNEATVCFRTIRKTLSSRVGYLSDWIIKNKKQ
jgi:hypothetical protein